MDRLNAGGRSLPRAVVLLLCLGALAMAGCRETPKEEIGLLFDEPAGRMIVLVGGREAVVYLYGDGLDLPHYWPMRSPSGKNMLVEKTEPYPHHRSFWFADTVRPEGSERDVSFYNVLYGGVKTEAGDYGPPFRDRIRHASFSRIEAGNGLAHIEAELVWEMDGGHPVLDERRRLVVRSLGQGEYLLDLTWTLTASHGDVHFVSDDVYYAWPFLRLDAVFNGEKGGKIVSDTGALGQEATNMKPALWIDYSNTVEGMSEGVAVFQWPDSQSGKPFTLKKGESITQRVGLLVHKGDIAGGRVRERYEKYVKGGWK